MIRLLSALFATALLAAPVALADDDREAGKKNKERDDDREDRGKNEPAERRGHDRREVRIEHEGSGLHFSIERKDDTGKASVSLIFDPEEGHFRLKTQSKDGTTKEKTHLKLWVREIVEYTDVNGNGAYDEGTDVRIGGAKIGDLDWRIGDIRDTSLAGTPAKAVTATGRIPGTNGSLGFAFMVAGDFARAGAANLTPDDVKFDIAIQDYPFTSPLSRLAILAKVTEKSSIKVDDDEEGLTVASEGARAYFRWAPNATVDGRDTAVIASVERTSLKEESDDGKFERESVTVVTLNYARGRYILHDPVLGIESEETVARAPGPAFAAAIAVVAGAAVMGRRARKSSTSASA